MELLRPQDAFYLYTDSASVQQHVGGVAILDPSTRAAGPLRPEDVAAGIAGRLHLLPRLRQRVAMPAAGLARPVWVDDDRFDVCAHVHGVALPAPAGRQELAALVDRVMATPLDRARPLWEAHLVERLDDGSQALLLKLHHAIADGLGALRVAALLLDGAPNLPPREPQPWAPCPVPGGARLLVGAFGRQVAAPLRALAAAARRGLTAPLCSARRGGAIALGVWELARSGAAPPGPLNGQVGTTRRIVLRDVPLERVRRIRDHFAVSVNDVVLTATLHALHALHGGHAGALRGAHAPRPTLRVVIPVALRPPERRSAPGTWTAALKVDLPAGPLAPVERLAAVRRRTMLAKSSHQAVGAAFVLGMAGLCAPPWLHARAARYAFRGHWFNLVVTTLRGRATPAYLAGARVLCAYPILPLVDGLGLTVAALTWSGRLTLGLTADPAMVPTVELLAGAMVHCIEELDELTVTRRTAAR
jgi:diacylglycerol O-acyltransferase / wax synthase